MSDKNKAQQLEVVLRRLMPESSISIQNAAPDHPNGSWFVDIRTIHKIIVIEWVPSTDFGLSILTEDDGIGSGHQERFEDVDSTVQRVIEICREEPGMTLKQMRESRNVSQVELARLLGIEQSSLSKFENRTDWRVNNLEKYISALGGRLELHVIFKDGSKSILQTK